MKMRREFLYSCEPELDLMIADYYAKTNAPEGQPPLKMVWRVYRELEQKNALFIVTARDDNILLGFAMYLLLEHPQHGMMPYAFCNTLAVGVEHRGQGIATALVKDAEVRLKAIGMEMIVHGHRMIYKVAPLFPKLGFSLIEQIYMKVL
jgi:GNAT superfamily N-acetyltransferase